jgi:hypothetical protein
MHARHSHRCDAAHIVLSGLALNFTTDAKPGVDHAI